MERFWENFWLAADRKADEFVAFRLRVWHSRPVQKIGDFSFMAARVLIIAFLIAVTLLGIFGENTDKPKEDGARTAGIVAKTALKSIFR